MRRSSSRYWFARLRPLGQPVFWAPAIALLLLGLFTWEFFSRPELVSYFGISTADENLSPEDQAIGADIDSLPLLMNDIKTAAQSAANSIEVAAPPQRSKPAQAPTTPLFSSAQSVASATPQLPPPESDSGAFGVFKNALTAELGLTSAVPDTSTSTPAALPPNQLEAAMSKLAAKEASVPSPMPIEGTARLEPSINAAPRSNNAFSALVEGAQPIQPGTPPPISIPLSIAPPINASVPAAPATVESIAPQPAPGLSSVQPAPNLNQQPFTTPRSIPGRTIGGGNINTFSNP